jgi:hypothetical protein
MKASKVLMMGAFLCAIIFTSKVTAQQWGLYTLYATKNGTQAYLIDTNSASYHTWSFSTSAKSAYSAYLVPGDTLVRSYKPSANPWGMSGGVTGGIQKVDWNSNVIWDFQYYAANQYSLHHDICPLPNGNVLMISYDYRTAVEATQAGSSSASVFYSEKVIEVKPTGATTGTIVWEWKLWDHLCQTYNAAKDNYVTSIIDNPQLLNINYAGTGSLPDRYHMNGIDYNAELDQIIVSMHYMNSAFVIDHSTTTAEAAGHTGGNSGKGGDFLYRWGNPASYGATGSTIFNIIHDAHWVPSDNPNYPDYLAAYNNKGGTGAYAAVDIWNPPYDGYNYTFSAGTAYSPSASAYQYTAPFTSMNEGNSQQLPNGNMLVNNSFGNVYEVNAAGTTLWSKTGTNSSHCYRYTQCYVRGPVATATASQYLVAAGTPITLSGSALSVSEASANYTYEWTSTPAGFTSTLQNPTDSPTSTTTYTLTVTNTNLGCSASTAVQVQVGSGLSDYENNERFSVSPNPTTGLLSLSGNMLNEANYEVCVYNAQGQMLLQQANIRAIDLSELRNGLYFLVLTSGQSAPCIRKVLLEK